MISGSRIARPIAAALLGLALVSAGPLASPAVAAPQTVTHGLGGSPTPGLPQGLSATASALVAQNASLPASLDLSQWAPPVGNQGTLNSCVSWAVGYYYRYWLRNRALGETASFAPMYVYSQLAKGNVNRSSTFPENFNILISQGIAHRADYPQGDFDYTTQPTSAEVAAAAPYRISSDTLLFHGASGANQTAVEASMAEGHPVLLLIPVYDNFYLADATHAFVDVPTAGTSRGNHAVFAVKYDAAGVWIENQWGTSWGNQGWVELSWAFVNQLAMEGWFMQGGATYHAMTPTRVLDTRNGTGGLSGPFTNHAARTFTVTGVPAGATAVTGNLTVTGQTSGGYLFIGPAATNNPGSSTLNFPVGDDRANAVTVQLSAGGTLSITFVGPNNSQSAQAIFDVTGYFTPDMTGATYHAVTPARVLDTRNGTGGLSGPFTNHAARTFTVTGVPAGATAVTGNLTVTGQTSGGYLFIGPAATNNPGSSTLNFPLGDDRANAVTVQIGAGGTLSITFVGPNNSQSGQAIFDVTGYFTPDMTGANYHAVTPARALDSRNGTGGLSGPFTNHAARTFTVTGVPAGATAVTGNLTVTGQTSGGYLFIGPVATNDPGSSTLNFPLGDDRANAVTVQISAGGTLSITFVGPNNSQSAQAIFDVTGYFTPAA